jgi:hypothetical protein
LGDRGRVAQVLRQCRNRGCLRSGIPRRVCRRRRHLPSRGQRERRHRTAGRAEYWRVAVVGDVA